MSDHPGGRRPPGWAVAGAAALYAALLVVITLLPIRWRSDLARYRNNRRPQLVPRSRSPGSAGPTSTTC